MVVPDRRMLLLVSLMLVGTLTLVPSMSAQQLCEEDLVAPTCIAPDVQVELPEAVYARRDAGIWTDDGSGSLTFPVNVTINGDPAPPDEEVTLTVEPEPIHGLEATGGMEVITPGDTVTIQVRLDLTPAVPAGTNPLTVHVNTTGTNVYTPTQQTVESDLLMFWWFDRTLTEVPDIRLLDDGSEYTFRVNNMTTNGPFDILLTSRSHVSDSRILEAPPGLSPDDPVTQEWTVRFHGTSDYAQWQMWPVVTKDDEIACIIDDTGELRPIEEDAPAEACQVIGGGGSLDYSGGQIGGIAGLALLVPAGFILLGTLGAVGLGFFVLRRGGAGAPARSLGTFLVLAGSAFGLLVLSFILTELFGSRVANRSIPQWVQVGMLLAMTLLPFSILTFALSYPTLHPRLKNVRAWTILPLTPSLLMAPFVIITVVMQLHTTLLVGMGTFILATATVSALVFWHRTRHASTGLERDRIRYMLRFVALPLAVGGGGLIGLALFQRASDNLILINFANLLAVMIALLPVLGMAWGLLRYKIVDLDTKLRLTVSRGFIGAVFIAVFFLVAELVKTYFSETLGPYIGLVAAALLIPALVPLQRLGRRLATRVVPEPPDPEAYQSFRRLEIYRAAYEEVAVDDRVTEKERRAMESLARSLMLTEQEVSFVEGEVEKEREAVAKTRTGAAAVA